jgi:glyoxylase-like metal-dependent hydrolase (beta-lactamase superfamily II)
MFDIIQAGEHTWYIENPARVGIYLDGTDVWLIDSGYSDTAAELILDIITAYGWKLNSIIVTHSHPDHSGGCSWLKQKTGCRIYAHGLNTALIQHPVVHPALSYGGYPCGVIRGKGMMADPCTAKEMAEHIPPGLEIIPLPGHFFDMVGIRTNDDVVFLADSICSESILKRYVITFLYDAEAYIETLEKIADMEASLFVPSHVAPTKDIRELALLNKINVLSVADDIISWCSTPVTFEKLLQKVFSEYQRTMNFEQYCLVGSTLHSYLAWLKNSGRVQTTFYDSELLWHSIQFNR